MLAGSSTLKPAKVMQKKTRRFLDSTLPLGLRGSVNDLKLHIEGGSACLHVGIFEALGLQLQNWVTICYSGYVRSWVQDMRPKVWQDPSSRDPAQLCKSRPGSPILYTQAASS